MINLKIDQEFQSQIPPLTNDEFKQLEENAPTSFSILAEQFGQSRPFRMNTLFILTSTTFS